MPGCSGAIFVRALREVKPEIPVMVISGMPEAEDEYQDMDIVFRAKPLPPPQLIALVRELLVKSEHGGS
jgi:DNA-binding NtrC family response regulator